MVRNKERWNRRELGWVTDSEDGGEKKKRFAETGGTEKDESVNGRHTMEHTFKYVHA